MNFTDRLQEWTDLDLAMHEFALQLGLVPKEASYSSCVAYYWGGKYHFVLKETIEKLVELGLLEFDEDETRVRTNKKLLDGF